jgi:hypothetical protein
LDFRIGLSKIMGFIKTARTEVLGVQRGGDWQKVSSRKFASFYMDGGGDINIEAALDTVADTYRISRDPDDYLLIPTRANSADRPNENMDGWRHQELLRFDPKIGQRVYQTYLLKPHFVNHNAANFALSRGVILDSHYNDANPASDRVKASVLDATGIEPDRDEFVETLIAMDMTKDPPLAEAYKNGSVNLFSMGCDVESTTCSVCDKVAINTFQFCEHVRSKHAKIAYPLEGGGHRKAFEWCNGTVFAEESAVDDPADKDAAVQEGLLQTLARPVATFSPAELHQITAFVAKNSHDIPEPLAVLINSALQGQ